MTSCSFTRLFIFPCAGKAGMLPLNLYARVRFSRTLHTRPRVQRAPGLPCALCYREGANEDANLGRTVPRDREVVSSRHCERSEAIHLPAYRKNRLLRFARNDVGRANYHLPPHPEEAAKRPSRRASRNSYPTPAFQFCDTSHVHIQIP